MSTDDLEAAVLIADISGSSALYEDVGDADALRLVSACLDKLRSVVHDAGGTFVRSKGDDVLAVFSDPSSALKAACDMLSQQQASLTIHVGASFGHVIFARDDVFGDTVNLSARLASVAKPGEILASQSFVDQLPEAESRWLRPLDSINFKGKSSATRVYTLLEDDALARTLVAAQSPTWKHTGTDEHTNAEVAVTLYYTDKTFNCRETATLSIGRSASCDVVIPHPWISREHAKLTVRRGKVQLSDQSLSGTYVSMPHGYEALLKRETVLLTGSGTICPAVQPSAPEAEVIRYEVKIHQGTRAP